MARAWRWIAALAAVAVVGGFVLWRTWSGQAAPDSAPERAVEQYQQGHGPLERERDELFRAVIGVNGELAAAEYGDGGWTVGVEFRDATPRLDALLKQAMQLFTELDRTRLPLRDVTVVFRTDELKDVYGHELPDFVIGRLRLAGDELRRIDWYGFEPKNLERLAAEWWIHPEVSSDQGQQQSTQAGGQGGSGGGGAGGGGGGGGGGDQSSGQG